MSKEDFLGYINNITPKLIKPVKEQDIFNSEIRLSYLKRIDSLFEKGINYYIDPKDPLISKEESIFFRKDNFNADLNIGAKKIVNRFEEEKIAFSTLSKLSDFKLNRKIPFFTIMDNPKVVANEMRDILYPNFVADKREFLKGFIEKLSDVNILVFEFVETYNKKEKANISGIYLSPNVIVLKRTQKSLRREIFTLSHELGHYLLNEEEIDYISNDVPDYYELNKIEKWCNDFAYYFLCGKFDETIKNLPLAESKNYYHEELFKSVSDNTHISVSALYTRLLLDKKITPQNYAMIMENINREIREWELREELRLQEEKELAALEGRKQTGSTPKPIISPLFLKTMQNALTIGLINEYEFCKRLNIKPEKLSNFYNESNN